MTTDSKEYRKKKAFFEKMLTVYGRKPVLEALQTQGLDVFKLHLSERNRPAAIIRQITELATASGAEVCYHSPEALSRISKNARQDQGVALDLRCPNFQTLEDFLANPPTSNTVIALDQVTNPQNLGMIIRSVTASPAGAIFIPKKGCAPLNSLVIKASAGTLFKAPIVQIDDLKSALKSCQKVGFQIASLDINASQSALEYKASKPTVFLFGNETNGISQDISDLCDLSLRIPMQRDVESLNVAVTASLIAFAVS